jgi:serine/threonine protein kinase
MISRLKLGLSAIRAVTLCHQMNVIHFDIKPSNMIVVKGEYITSDPRVLLIDLGCARFVRTPFSVVSANHGTVTFQSPEQAGFQSKSIHKTIATSTSPSTSASTSSSADTDATESDSEHDSEHETIWAGFPSDVYALAGTLFFVMTGVFPWHGVDRNETSIRAHMKHELINAETAGSTVPAFIDPTVHWPSPPIGLPMPANIATILKHAFHPTMNARPTVQDLAVNFEVAIAALSPTNTTHSISIRHAPYYFT